LLNLEVTHRKGESFRVVFEKIRELGFFGIFEIWLHGQRFFAWCGMVLRLLVENLFLYWFRTGVGRISVASSAIFAITGAHNAISPKATFAQDE
jgi:hypothetical protein